MKKTYGVYGLMEWSAIVGNGNVSVRVEFSGGSVTGYGVTPAEYSTDNPVVQTLIENSRYFRNGRIRLLRGKPGVTPLPAGDVNVDKARGKQVADDGGTPKRVSVNEAREMLKRRGCKGEDLLGEGLFRLAAVHGLEIERKQ